MFNGFSGRQRVAPLSERRVAVRLREALAALPAPWVVLANRRASGADGPPWVRFLALHPERGIALVDTETAEAAVAPLEDFLARTGFPALRAGSLPIVPVAIGAGELGVIADLLDAALAAGPGTPGNPNWCEAVVELLLAAPDLMLAQLRRAPSAAHGVASKPPQQREAAPEFPLPEPLRRAEPPRRAAPEPPPQSSRVALPPRATSPEPPPVTEPEPPRLVPRRVQPTQPPAPSSDDDVRLVPRRVTPAAEVPPPRRVVPRVETEREPPLFGDDPGRSRPGHRSPPAEPAERAEPRFGSHAEPQFALEAGEPIIPMRQTGESRRREPSLRTGALRPDSALTDWQPRRRRWPYAAAAMLLLTAVGAIAVWYREAPPPVETASSGSPLSTATVTPPSTSTTAAATSPTHAAATPAPSTPSLHAAMVPQPKPASPAPHATAQDLPRAMLQPKIAAAPPPLPLPLPEAKLAPPPVRAAAAKPKPEKGTKTAVAKPIAPKRATKTAVAKSGPAPKAVAADHNLPAPIAAVLYPDAVPPAPPAPSSATTIRPRTQSTTSTQPAAPTPPATVAAAPPGLSTTSPGGTVTVNGVTYVNGEQPHSLGTLSSSSAPEPSSTPASASSSAVASNGPAATAPALLPNEVVISRAPSALPITPAANGATPSADASSSGTAMGATRGTIISRAPSGSPVVPAADAAMPAPDAPSSGGAYAVPSNPTPSYATGSPQSIQAAPLPGSSP